MALQKLPALETTTKAAATEKTYDAWFMRDLHIQANSEEAKARIIATRYDYDQKAIGTEHIKFTADAYVESTKWQCWSDAITAVLKCVALVTQKEEATRAVSAIEGQKSKLQSEKQELLDKDVNADTSALDLQITELDAQVIAKGKTIDGIHAKMGPLS